MGVLAATFIMIFDYMPVFNLAANSPHGDQ